MGKLFEEFGFHQDIMEGLDAMGFKEATPVQEQAIPAILEGKDIVACAQTGTGKTAAFLLPVLDQLVKREIEPDSVDCLILVPTRELAIQIDQQIEGLSYFLPISSLAIYGGGDSMSWDQQKKALEHGANIIIATPGRLISHLSFGYTKFNHVAHLVLDEADRMLDMGFHDDIEKIITYLPKKRQNLLFSATMPPKMRKLANAIAHDPAEVNLAVSKPAAGVLQAAYVVYDKQKIPIIEHILNEKELPSVIIFSSRKSSIRDIVRALHRKGFNAKGISSDLDQEEREQVLLDFRNRKTQIIVATDVMSRGIDIKDINLVINYDVPMDAEDYVHRVGRTARADSTGVAITFINDNDQYRFKQIEDLIEMEVYKTPIPPEFGEGPAYEPTKRRGSGGGGRGGRFKGKKGGGGGGNRNGGHGKGGGGYKGGNRNKRKGGGGNRPQGNKPQS